MSAWPRVTPVQTFGAKGQGNHIPASMDHRGRPCTDWSVGMGTQMRPGDTRGEFFTPLKVLRAFSLQACCMSRLLSERETEAQSG